LVLHQPASALMLCPPPSLPMPQKRDVLTHLTRDELVAITDTFDLPVNDRRVKDKLVEAVASSHKAMLATILAGYPRDRLKELCRALALDDGGREKTLLVERAGLGPRATQPKGFAGDVGPTKTELARAEKWPCETADELLGGVQTEKLKVPGKQSRRQHLDGSVA
jgi:hypothetical protein